MTYRHDLPVSKRASEVWTYWVTRDSLNGELNGKCSLWCAKPLRVHHRYRVTWVGTDPRKPGHLGDFRPDEIEAWFGEERIPATDIQCFKIEQGVTEKMKRGAKK